MVSIHVPAHAEPPEFVIATLDALANLDYPNFEVLLIDNNTADEELWRPVERHCEDLGPRFRFLHVEGITGAKAGALNWALPQTDLRAELIAVVDADYQVHPDWLAHTVGHFEDPELGFVQYPHAYRDFEDSLFGTMANTEYSVFFSTSMVSLAEHGAGLTVGTMSVIRRRALVEAGGWAEWCLTEDSELAIRIHAAGYSSIYITQPYGWGLIPETFDAYKKQRFRWTYGPVQELKHHVGLFIPGRARTGAQLSKRQQLHHANHGLDVVMVGLRLLALPILALALISMIVNHDRIVMPFSLWIAVTAILLSSNLLRWLIYRRVLHATLRQMIGAVVAFTALSHAIAVASLSSSVGRSAQWRRTDKFRPSLTKLRVLHTTWVETVLGAACLLIAGSLLVAESLVGIATAIALGLAIQGARYLTAPVVAAIAERDLRNKIDREIFATDGPVHAV